MSGSSIREGGWRRDVEELVEEGVASFKLYLLSGMETYRDLTPEEIREVLVELVRHGVPAGIHAEDHALVRGTVAAVEAVPGLSPKVSRWHFSTNGVASMGRLGIPSIGFAPGLEELSHSTGEWVAVEDLVKATAAYSLMPAAFAALAPELKRKA